MILKLKPYMVEKIWGGKRIVDLYKLNAKAIGECVGISGHSTYPIEIINTEFKGMTMQELYSSNRELFGNYPSDEFPIIVKTIDANDSLSVQLHPDDEYARKVENQYGKEECWYILDCDENADIIVGHSATNKDELIKAINNNDILSVINKHSIKPKDYFYIPSKTIHAIRKGTFVLEVSQSSDVTYRVYDYNRTDDEGNTRELHIEKSIDVTRVPDSEVVKTHRDKYFTFEILHSDNSKLKADKYGDYLYIIDGEGRVGDVEVTKGDFLMISADSKYEISNDIEYMLSKLI